MSIFLMPLASTKCDNSLVDTERLLDTHREMQYIIIGNFGNHSLAVMQALIERGKTGIHFVYVNTGWAASSWAERVSACSDYAKSQGVEVHPLNAQATFLQMVMDRKQFPSPKFQWCASFLKGLALLDFLDEFDPACEAIVVSGKRQCDSRRYANLQEFEQEDDLYQGRTVWYPLWQTTNHEFTELIQRTGFTLLPHQSLECNPCIHVKENELSSLDPSSIERLEALEQAVGETMYSFPIRSLCKSESPSPPPGSLNLQQFDLGCGSPWGCGE
ncbi:phosphoadenosine phosphosulfate reductase family protein [Legionella micdadei]|nr:phosphoadenosine phosphosulfate reductase family protein [Legionella micdadei]